MQIANGYVSTCPEIKHYCYGITPAEAVILKKMHNAYANGSPLSGFVIVGEATEVDQFGHPATKVERKPFKRLVARMENGSAVMTEIADYENVYTPSTKPRSNTEEISRLRRKYTGNVTENGKTVTAWESAFGGGAMVSLPQTFEEVESIIGPVFSYATESDKTVSETNMDAPEPPKRIGRPPKVQPETQPVEKA